MSVVQVGSTRQATAELVHGTADAAVQAVEAEVSHPGQHFNTHNNAAATAPHASTVAPAVMSPAKRKAVSDADASTAHKAARLPVREHSADMAAGAQHASHAAVDAHGTPAAAAVDDIARERYTRVAPLFSHFFTAYTDNHLARMPDSAAHHAFATPVANSTGAAGVPAITPQANAEDGRQQQQQPPATAGRGAHGASLWGSSGVQLHDQLTPRLRSLAGDLQASSRYGQLDVVSAVQHNPTSSRGKLQGRKMVCAVALDRLDENLATVGALCLVNDNGL